MPRKNANALTTGNAPRRGPVTVTRTARDEWTRLVSNVAGSAWETSAQVAAQLTDAEGIPQRTEGWYARAVSRYRELTAVPSR